MSKKRSNLPFRKKSECILIYNNKYIVCQKAHSTLDNRTFLRFPGGGVDKGESLEKTAKRELLEETGYSSSNLRFLTRFYPSIGYNLQYIDCYLTTKPKKISNQKLDDGEFVTVEKIPIKKIISMIKSGKILDAKTICAVMIYAAKTNIL